MKHSSIRFLLLALLAAQLMGCDDDCPTCPEKEPPEEKEYHFLYSFVGGFYSSWVYTFSTKTLEVVDSTYYGTLPFNDMRFSKDGRYAFYTVSEPGAGRTWMTDYASGDTISIIEGVWGHWLQLFSDEKHLILSGGGIYLRVLSIPDLTIAYERLDSNGWGDAGTHPISNTAFIPRPGRDSLMRLSQTASGFSESNIALKSEDGQAARSFSATVSLDGRLLVLSAGDYPTGAGFKQVRDSETLELLHQFNLGRPVIGAFRHPDARRLFYVEFNQMNLNNPGALWELDLMTFLMRRVIDGNDIVGSGWPLSGFNANDMDITPDGRFAIFMGGGGGFAFGPVLKVDLQDYRIVAALYPPLGVQRVIRINPLEIKKEK